MKRRILLQASAAVLALPRLVRAQAYPTKPIRYIVPVAAGGGNDMIARVVTQRWGAVLGQPFVAVPSEPGYVWSRRFSRQTCPSACEPKPLTSTSYLITVRGSLSSCARGAKNCR